jgi:hypothetical protein
MRDRFHPYWNLSFILVILFLTAFFHECRGAEHRAAYMPEAGSILLVVELVSTHAFLAEYDRFAVLVQKEKEICRRKLFPDSGGYAATNLYRCSRNRYVLKGYFDSWVVDLNDATISEGKCGPVDPEYIGIFEGGGSRPWKFYPSSEREEKKLVPKGG